MKKNPPSLGRWILVGLLLVGLASTMHAQTAVNGVILNGANGQPVRGAAVSFEGAETTATSDLDGLVLVRVAEGTYTVTVTKDGFEPKKVTGVVVDARGGNFAVVLDPVGGTTSGQTLTEEITVEAAAAELSTEEALLSARKNAVQISDSIGTEEMKKSGGSDAAGVIKRVTGVSLQDGKYAFVRGLGGRYSSTAVNGSKVPSTEFEEKVVPLDLFPSGLIEKITVSKSYTVDKPADFAAGVIELSTVKFPSNQIGSLGFGLDWNSMTTGDDYLEAAGGLDFFGGGAQGFPSAVPDEPLFRSSPLNPEGFTPQELEEIGEAIGGRWTPDTAGDAPPGLDFKASYGNSVGNWGYVLSASLENETTNRFEDQAIFRVAGDDVRALNDYTLDFTDEKVRQAVTGNFTYRSAENHQIRFRSLYTNISTAESRILEGFFNDIDSNVRNFRVSFLEQDVINLQLSGDHYWDGLGDGGLFEWRASTSEATTDEDRRESLYEEQEAQETYILTDNAQSGFIFTNDLEDTVDDFGVDWSSFFGGDSTFGSIKLGVALTNNDRLFDGRRIRFDHRRTVGFDLTLPPEELFDEDTIGPNGFELQEITRPTDTYSGEQEILAGYAQGDVAWGDWRFVGGVRVEDSDQQVFTQSRTTTGDNEVVSVVADTDVLPAFNLTYKLSEDTNLRFAASQTVNRPEFRELAPFAYTNVTGGFEATGNPDLVRAKITSYDLRWEWFPAPADVVAASIFYKDFENPIEKVQLGGPQLTESWVNAQAAENFGFELEFRRNLEALAQSLDDFTLIFNYAYVSSEVTLDRGDTVITNEDRALVGQPDNVANAILEWNPKTLDTVVRVLYNFTDDKVASAGGFGLPDVILNARDTVDVVWNQGIGSVPGLSFKASASNLLDEEWLWSQGSGVFRRYEPGRTFGVSLSYRPFE